MHKSRCVASRVLPVLVVLVALPALAGARDRLDCEREFQPQVGQTGKNVIWVPTPDDQVAEMLTLADVSSSDVVYDLGAGDGKIAIAASKRGAQAVGIEYDEKMARFAQCNVEAEGAGRRARIVQGDIFKEDFSRATVVTMYLLPELNLCLRHRLLAMRPGTRVASHQFMMEDWKPDVRSQRGSAYLWIVPARIAGDWTFESASGKRQALRLTQQFQNVTGELDDDGRSRPLSEVSLLGDRLRFVVPDGRRGTWRFEGVVRDDSIVGTLQRGNKSIETTARRQGDAPPADWAAMPDKCREYYAT
jgi:SAM-dependent methyltransferase